MAKPTVHLVTTVGAPKPAPEITKLALRAAAKLSWYELTQAIPLVLWYDEKSEAFYTQCHLEAVVLTKKTDLEAVLDPEESEEYKLNREIYTDNFAYRQMETDARLGRSFEDIVVEYDETYRPNTPLKVFGGQHRVQALHSAVDDKPNNLHGIRMYFGLTIDQKIDIAIANNTSIAVSNDLLDRMQEDLLGQELRDWAQETGLLGGDQGFADTRSSAGVPTVRIARTFIVNFHGGARHKKKAMPAPYVCKSGPRTDPDYELLRPAVKWKDKGLLRAGREFARIHAAQRRAVLGRDEDKYLEFANNCAHPSVVAAWSYVAGMLSGSELDNHYGLADTSKQDPMNASALSKARLKGVDPDTYRGLGARIGPGELGRMVQLFLLQATKASKRGITKTLANAAIQSYEALKATAAAEQATKRI